MKFSLLFATALLSVASAIPTEMDSSDLEARQFRQCGNPDDAVPFYRLYNSQAVDHFYTTDAQEANNAIARFGYTDEGISSYIFPYQESGTVPFYRLYSPTAMDHFYTTSASEANNAEQNLGYNSEGVAGYIYPNRGCRGTVPFYRLYNPSGMDHFYTTSASERDNAAGNGYNYEGIAGYVYPHYTY
ncbi:hypothetical protein E4T56_gene7175 [Termitomyces sp. T112]|nr:hypothetical protein E4T56_gene7175 [Termitomyces sp. T112]KAH0579829.1 hypothetical protein H2248_002657 [Termitomyces sp. 'cryptogamus']